MATPVSGAKDPERWLLLNGQPLSFMPESENITANAHEYGYNNIRPTASTPDDLKIFIDEQELEPTVNGRWDWRPKDYAGLYELTARSAHFHNDYKTYIRVFPHKFTATIYDKMKADLSEFAVDLLFQLHSEASEKIDFIQRMQETSPLHDYRQIKTIMNQLQNTFAHIRTNPYTVLRKQRKTQNWQQVHQFASTTYPIPIGGALKLPQRSPLPQANTLTHLPQKWSVQQNILTYDVHENRLLKQFLQKQLIARLHVIEDQAQKEIERRKQQSALNIQKKYENREPEAIKRLLNAIEDCQQMKRQCLIWCREPFLEQVAATAHSSKATQVLLKHPHYSHFYQLYLQLQKQFKIKLDSANYITRIALRKVSELYEMWSVFQITNLIIKELCSDANGYSFASETIFYELEKNYFQFDVRKNHASIVLTKGDVRVEIKYEPYYPNHQTVKGRAAIVATTGNLNPWTPDMVVEVYEQGIPKHVMVFDAKYRWDKKGNAYYPLEKSIGKMRTYRDTIQYQQAQPSNMPGYMRQRGQSGTQEKIVSSSYAIYPGTVLYHEPGNNDIGGLPLSPNMPAARLEQVRQRLSDLLYQAYLID